MSNPAVARAQTLVALGRHAEAAAELAPHLASHPDDVDALRQMALVQIALGQVDDALLSADHAMRLAPGDPASAVVLAHVLRGLGRVSEARLVMDHARRMHPNSTAVLGAWIFAHLGVGQIGNWGRRKALLAASEELLRLAPQEAESHQLHAIVRRDLGHYRRADAAYRRARALAPADAQLAHDHASVEVDLNRFGSAIATYTGHLAAEPDSVLAMFNLRVTASRFLRVVWLVLFGAGYLSLRLASSDPAVQQQAHLWTAVAVWVIVIVLVAIAVITSRGSFLKFARAVPVIDRSLLISAAGIGVLLVIATITVLAPSIPLLVLTVLAYLAAFLGNLRSWRELARTRAELERCGMVA